MPTVSAFANYNWIYLSDKMSQLYNQAYPTSSAGLQVSLPIFQGTRRIQELQIAQLQEERLEVDVSDVKRAINTDYQAAIASFRSYKRPIKYMRISPEEKMNRFLL